MEDEIVLVAVDVDEVLLGLADLGREIGQKTGEGVGGWG